MALSTLSNIRVFSRGLFFSVVVCLLFCFSSAFANETENHTPSITIVVFGDSLSAAFGINQNEGWVHLLQQQLSNSHYQADVINTSISGETTQGGLSRIAHVLDTHRPDIVLLELGGNDGLRGLPLTLMRENMERMIQIIQSRGIKILLLGIQLPPNYGKFYTQQFQQTYIKLAKKYDLSLVPFLLDGVATHVDLMQEDGIHPKANAQKQILDNVWLRLKPLMSPQKIR